MSSTAKIRDNKRTLDSKRRHHAALTLDQRREIDFLTVALREAKVARQCWFCHVRARIRAWF
jgi:hypothetical protein